MKRSILALIAVLLCMPFAASTLSAQKTSMGMVTDVGGIHDASFNDSAWRGHLRAQAELGFDVEYKESHTEADYAANLEAMLADRRDLIWGVGFLMQDAVDQAAIAHPEQKYACIDVAFENPPANLIGVTFKDQESSFLVGYIAGKISTAKKLGFVGGMESDVIARFEYGFRAGVRYADPQVEVLVEYADNFADVEKGKAIATRMYGEGADIVFHAAGLTGIGVIEAAKELHGYVIGVDQDQSPVAPENVITSAVKNVDMAIFNIAKDMRDGRFEGGRNVAYGLAEGGVGISESSGKFVPSAILDEVDALTARIIAGEIVVPTNQAEFEAFGQ